MWGNPQDRYSVCPPEIIERLSWHRFNQESLSTSSELFCKRAFFLAVSRHVILLFLTGLSHFPRSEKAEIYFSLSDAGSYHPYTESIKKFLELYEDDKQLDQLKYEDCGGKYELQVERELFRDALIQIGPFGVVCSFSLGAR